MRRYIRQVCFVLLMFCGVDRLYAAVSPFAAMEVISPAGKKLSDKGIKMLATEIGSSAVYQWNNHLVLYGQLKNPDMLHHQLMARYPGCEVKTYKDPFYVFDKKQRCGNKGVANQWTNIILTANLVADIKKQQEYLNYHKTQFEKWPEVSNGFCNASFQQLLVFKSGRQLMLVISIPKGKTLDELNPLTTKNNLRVDEWNKIMSKYQEGITGTKKGETWVFFRPLAESGSPKGGKSESQKSK